MAASTRGTGPNIAEIIINSAVFLLVNFKKTDPIEPEKLFISEIKLNMKPPSTLERNNGEDIVSTHTTIVSTIISLCFIFSLISASIFHSEIFQEVFFLLLIIPVYFQVKYKTTDLSLFYKTYSFSFLYLLPLLISFSLTAAYSSIDLKRHFALLFNTMFSFFLASFFASNRSSNLWPKTLRRTSIMLVLFIVFAMVTQRNAYIWGRWLGYAMHPNWWGMIALSLAWSTILWKQLIVRLIMLGIPITIMLMAQSRGAMVALLPIIFINGISGLLKINRIGLLIIAGLLTFSCAAVYIKSPEYYSHIYDTVANKVFKANDPQRGIGSGMTGRTENYAIAWEVFQKSPFFGGGPSNYSDVHNGFLITLSEAGLFAFFGMFLLFATSIRGFFRERDWFGFGTIVSYILLLMTYNRCFNLNMTSLIFLMIMMKGIALKFNTFTTSPIQQMD